MRNSERTSVVLVGLVTGLLSMMPMAVAEDRHELLRLRAADTTFVPIDPPDATSSAALDINTAGKIVGRYVSRVDGIRTASCETGSASSRQLIIRMQSLPLRRGSIRTTTS